MAVIGSWNLKSQQMCMPELVPRVNHCWWLFTQNDVMTPCFKSFSRRHVVPGHRKSHPTNDPYSEAYTRTDCEPESRYWISTAQPSSCRINPDIYIFFKRKFSVLNYLLSQKFSVTWRSSWRVPIRLILLEFGSIRSTNTVPDVLAELAKDCPWSHTVKPISGPPLCMYVCLFKTQYKKKKMNFKIKFWIFKNWIQQFSAYNDLK